MGLINSSGNMGGWVGPYMLGFINGHTGSFTYGYYVMGACMFLAALLDFNITKIYGTQRRTKIKIIKIL